MVNLPIVLLEQTEVRRESMRPPLTICPSPTRDRAAHSHWICLKTSVHGLLIDVFGKTVGKISIRLLGGRFGQLISIN